MNHTLPKGMRIRFNPLLWALLFGLVCTHPVSAQYYDLTVGTERHFMPCIGLTGVCPASSSVAINSVEKVIGSTTINGHNYAIVTWTQYSEGKIINLDTTLYRMDGSILIEHTGNDEQPIFDFAFSEGDSLEKKLRPYITNQNIWQYMVHQSTIASTIRIDTTILFNDGVERRILWGDDPYITTSGDTIYHVPRTIHFNFYEFLPWPEGTLNVPFYYVSDFGVILTPFNHRGILMCGYRSAENQHFGCDALVSTSIPANTDHPTSVVLHQNYPNPFNPSTQLRWTLDTARQTRLSVHDLLGREVTVLADGVMPAGSHQAVFDGAGLASGIYLVRLEADGAMRTLRITLMK